MTNTAEVITALRAYQGPSIWEDVISQLDTFDAAATAAMDPEGTQTAFVASGRLYRHLELFGGWTDSGPYGGDYPQDGPLYYLGSGWLAPIGCRVWHTTDRDSGRLVPDWHSDPVTVRHETKFSIDGVAFIDQPPIRITYPEDGEMVFDLYVPGPNGAIGAPFGVRYGDEIRYAFAYDYTDDLGTEDVWAGRSFHVEELATWSSDPRDVSGVLRSPQKARQWLDDGGPPVVIHEDRPW